MNKEKGEERRVVPRIKKFITVQYSVKDYPAAGVDISQTKDLSEKGIYFTVSNPLAAKDILNIKLKLPAIEKTIDLQARVVACEEIRKNIVYGIRAEFVDLEDEQKKILQDFIQPSLKDQIKGNENGKS